MSGHSPTLVASFNLNSSLEACLCTWSPGTWGFNICTSLTAIMSFLLVYLWGGLGRDFCHHYILTPAVRQPACPHFMHSWCSVSHTLCKAHMGPQLAYFCFVFLIRSDTLQATLCFAGGIFKLLTVGAALGMARCCDLKRWSRGQTVGSRVKEPGWAAHVCCVAHSGLWLEVISVIILEEENNN